ncbi:enoyl-CoA hydratase [Marinobacterium halophilum]|uniref:Enoyl-CoA hydratase n=1 Tax=Marinobacterium halophilum TaxID=267374 RepID=A0A2P8EGZ5_9GAMM|nr:enoyl-CoA hydratase family protein [Marinobacterium halophilum]PSL08755.1 enoyl-CoA hydratase [Marinobacterium halophilum]
MNNVFSVNINSGIGELVISKPPVNALNSQEWFDLSHEVDRLGQHPDISVIVIRAEGRGFCAGVDIKELDQNPDLIVKVNAGNYAAFKSIHQCEVPVIVAVHGFVLGGGIGITGAADIVFASECATFALPEVDRGAMGGGAHLQRLFPVQKVRQMFFTGETVTAQEAYRYNFIEAIVPKDQLRETALATAAKIAAKSPAMIRIAKEALNGIEDGNLEDKYRWEQGFTLQAYTSPDSAETRRAFVEKRDASF